MNFRLTTLLSLSLLWANLLFAQTSTPFSWQRIVLPTTPQAITMKNGILYAHTKHESFKSVDFGDTWQPVTKHIDASFIEYDATDLIYLMPPTQWNGSYPTFSSSWNAHGANNDFNGFSRFTVGVKGSTGEKLYLSSARILNDRTIFYHKKGVIFSNIQGSTTSFYEKNGIIFPDGRASYKSAPSNIIAHLDTFFLSYNYNENKLYFIGDTSFVSFNEKSTPITGTIHIDTDSTLFILSENGKYAKSNDLGDTWAVDSIPFTGITYYDIRQSMHVFHLNNDSTVVSKDLVNFHFLPQGYTSYVFDDLIIAFKDSHDYLRSFDHGATWDYFNPYGISTTKVNKMKLFEDTLYVTSEQKLFKQTCIDKFDISPNNFFLLNSDQYNINSSTSLTSQPIDCYGCTFKFFDAGDFYFATGELGTFAPVHKNYYRQKNDSTWIDISQNIPYWEFRYKSKFYYNVYSFSRAYSDIYYHNQMKSFYVSTSDSGLNRSSAGVISPGSVASIQLACDSPDTTYLKYQSCQPDTLFFTQPISYDTLFIHKRCRPDTIDYQGVAYSSPGTHVVGSEKNQLGCDSVYHQIVIIDNFLTPQHQYKYDFLCLGDTLFINDIPITEPGIYPYDTIVSHLGCDSIIIRLNLKAPTIDTIEVNAVIGEFIAGVEINSDTMFTQVIWSSTYNCESVFKTYIVHIPTAAIDLVTTNIRIYPNPTKSTLVIDQIPYNIHKIYITDATGNTMFFCDTVKSNLILNTSTFPEGVYVINLVDQNKHTWHKIFTKISN